MSKPRKMVEMPKDMFSIYLTVALVAGMFIPDIYQALAVRFG